MQELTIDTMTLPELRVAASLYRNELCLVKDANGSWSLSLLTHESENPIVNICQALAPATADEATALRAALHMVLRVEAAMKREAAFDRERALEFIESIDTTPDGSVNPPEPPRMECRTPLVLTPPTGTKAILEAARDRIEDSLTCSDTNWSYFVCDALDLLHSALGALPKPALSAERRAEIVKLADDARAWASSDIRGLGDAVMELLAVIDEMEERCK